MLHLKSTEINHLHNQHVFAFHELPSIDLFINQTHSHHKQLIKYLSQENAKKLIEVV